MSWQETLRTQESFEKLENLRTGGRHRQQTVFSILTYASMALRLSTGDTETTPMVVRLLAGPT